MKNYKLILLAVILISSFGMLAQAETSDLANLNCTVRVLKDGRMNEEVVKISKKFDVGLVGQHIDFQSGIRFTAVLRDFENKDVQLQLTMDTPKQYINRSYLAISKNGLAQMKEKQLASVYSNDSKLGVSSAALYCLISAK